MLCDISSADVNPLNRIIDGESLENGTTMANTVATIKDEARCLASGIQTQHGLLLEEDLGDAELLEENVGSLSAVIVRIKRWICQQNGVLFRRDLELIENMAPKRFHIIPVGDDTVLNRVVELEDSAVFVLHINIQNFTLNRNLLQMLQ